MLAVLAWAAPGAGAQTATQTAELAFGRFAANSGGAVTVRANGTRIRSGGVVLLASTASPASFTVASSGNQQIVITLPADGSTVLQSGAASMPLTGFASNRSNGVLTNPKQPLTIGATLQVAPNQRGGNYSGTFHVILEYQ